MIKRWKQLPPADRLKVQLVIGFILLGAYGAGLYPFTHRGLFESSKSIHRIKDRLEKRAKVDTKSMNANPQVVQRKIDEVDRRLAEVNQSFNELDTGFAPVESAEVRQQLLLEITTLADRTGVTLLAVSRKGLSTEDGMVAAPLDATVGRPLLVLTANSQFRQLVEFLKGLKDLSFYVSVMNMKLYSRQLEEQKGRLPLADGTIYVALEMSM